MCKNSRLELPYKRVFLKLSPNSQENTCVEVSCLIKMRLATLLKMGLRHSFYSAIFEKRLRTPFFNEHFRWLFFGEKERFHWLASMKWLLQKQTKSRS